MDQMDELRSATSFRLSWRDVTLAVLSLLGVSMTYIGISFAEAQKNQGIQIEQLNKELVNATSNIAILQREQRNLVTLQLERLKVQDERNNLMRDDIKDIKDSLREIDRRLSGRGND